MINGYPMNIKSKATLTMLQILSLAAFSGGTEDLVVDLQKIQKDLEAVLKQNALNELTSLNAITFIVHARTLIESTTKLTAELAPLAQKTGPNSTAVTPPPSSVSTPTTHSPSQTPQTWREKWERLITTNPGKELYFIWHYLPQLKPTLLSFSGGEPKKQALMKAFSSMIRKTANQNPPVESEDILVEDIEKSLQGLESWDLKYEVTAATGEILRLRDELNITTKDFENVEQLRKDFNLLPGLAAERSNGRYEQLVQKIKTKMKNYRERGKYI